MHPEHTPFTPGWWSFNLKGYRPCRSTYGLFPYAEQPPIDPARFGDEFEWLAALPQAKDPMMPDFRSPEKHQRRLGLHLQQLRKVCERRGLTLPPAFLKFMGSAALQNRIPSCTACYFDLSRHVIPSPAGDDGLLIRFLNDQQAVILWYLYFKPGGDHCVIASPYFLDDLSPPDDPDMIPSPDEIMQSTVWCAPTFETFIYRFWIENALWFALSHGDPMPPGGQAYLDHFKRV
jgi:hypothetical protein